MSDEAEECKCPPPGLPAYMGTFADLMALLMCFFVLLLAFSEMDVLKFTNCRLHEICFRCPE